MDPGEREIGPEPIPEGPSGADGARAQGPGGPQPT